MSLEEAIRQRVSYTAALNELRAHGFSSVEFSTDPDGTLVWLTDDQAEVVSKRGRDGLYSGRAVLTWLGY